MWKWMNKRGVSPLIAAVLLIVVVVGVGAVVTGIVRNYVTSGKQTIQSKSGDIKCGAEVDISVPTVANEIRVCVDETPTPKTLNFTLDNTGSALIDDLQLKTFYSGTVGSNDSIDPTGISIGGTETFSIDLPSGVTDADDIEEVQIVPRIEVVGRSDLAYCVDSALKFTPQACNE